MHTNINHIILNTNNKNRSVIITNIGEQHFQSNTSPAINDVSKSSSWISNL